jgi:hypothetical protein
MWISPGPPVSSTIKTYCHDITEILLKVSLNTNKQTNKQTSKQKNKQTSKQTNKQHFIYIQDENKFSNINPRYRNEERNGSTTFEGHNIGQGQSILFFVEATMCLLFFSKSAKDVFSVQGAWHSLNVAHYGP